MQVSASLTRVQALAHSGLSQVPPQFIQSPDKRPITHDPRAATDAEVPVIDLFGFDPEKRDSVREAIGKACREWGLFYVTNPGIPINLLDDIRRVGITFFQDQPMSEKLRYACDPSSAMTEGYGSRMLDNGGYTLDWRDYFDHHTFPLSRRNPSRWPDFPSDYREVVAKFSDEMKVLAQKLMGLISESLGMKTSCIEDAVGDIFQNVAFSYYPPCPQPELTLGLQSHSDIGAITLLVQDDVAGLQALKVGDDKWINVKPLPQAVLAILGDQTEIITNGKYRSNEHRAITNSERPRFTVATFHDPPKTVKISPASELVGESSPQKYKGVVYGDYISTWYKKGPEGKRNIDALLLDS